jgi:hypothetical protein
MVRLALAVFCVGLGAMVVAWGLPERIRLRAAEGELEAVLRQEAAFRAEKEVFEVHYRAMREDHEFAEVMARDRLDRCRPGERVLRIERGGAGAGPAE